MPVCGVRACAVDEATGIVATMSRPVLRTSRLVLRPMTIEHLPLLHQLDTDPQVMRYLLGRARTPEEIEQFWTPRCVDTIADAAGLGWWVGFLDEPAADARIADATAVDANADDVTALASGAADAAAAAAAASGDATAADGMTEDSERFVGWWDLGRSDSDPQDPVPPDSAEIGWRVARRHWRQGLATEGAEALLRHGFQTVGLDRVWAETMAVNRPSRGVMEKIGMRLVGAEVRHWEHPLPGADQGEVTYEIRAAQWRARREA